LELLLEPGVVTVAVALVVLRKKLQKRDWPSKSGACGTSPSIMVEIS
jgi:hypothetical protein